MSKYLKESPHIIYYKEDGPYSDPIFLFGIITVSLILLAIVIGSFL